MPRRTPGIMLVAVMAALAGCTGQSPSSSGSGSFTPDAGVCHRIDVRESDQASYAPLSCKELHEAETVHVGAFVESDHKARPVNRTPAMRKTFDVCDAAATEYVGGEWRGARLLLRVVLPTERGWTSGERWYRCDLSEILGMEYTDPHPRQGSLKGVLGGRSDLAFGCFNVADLPNGEIGGMIELESCAVSHHAEYTGVWRAPDMPYADVTIDGGPGYVGCRAVVADHVGVPDDDDLERRTEVALRWPPESEWLDGDRGIRCFLWVRDRDLTRSLRGAGTEGLPVSD